MSEHKVSGGGGMNPHQGQQKHPEDALHFQPEWCRVALASIGDAVITTDTEGRVTFLNSVAESLTGWRLQEAVGQPLDTVFRIINEESSQPVESPTSRALWDGVVVGLADHTILIARDGTERPIDDNAAPIRNEKGEVGGVVLVFRDISERRRAEALVRDSEVGYRRLFEAARDGILILDAVTGKITNANPFMSEMLGYTPDELLGKELWQIGLFQDREASQAAFRRLQEGGYIRYEHLPLQATSGHQVDVEFVSNLYQVDGQSVIQCNIRDITERRAGEAALAWMASFPHLNPDPFAEVDLEGRVHYLNPAAERLFPDLKQKQTQHPWLINWDEVVRECGQAVDNQIRRDVFVDNRWCRQSISFVESIQRLRIYGQDITERKQVEDALQASERRFRALIEHNAEGLAIHDITGVFRYVSPSLALITGYSEDEMLGTRPPDFLLHQDLGPCQAEWNALCSQPGSTHHWLHRIRRKDGSLRWLSILATNLLAEPAVSGIVANIRDITERKQDEERHQDILKTAMDGYWQVDMQGGLLEVNDTYCRMSGYSSQELLTMSVSDLEANETPTDTAAHFQKFMAQGEDRFESRHRRKDGSIFDVEISGQYRPTEGGRLVVFLRDITEKVKAEEERTKLDSQMREAQKLESLGVLAGGIAHDFNNMLVTILGYADLAQEDLPAGSPVGGFLHQIVESSRRAADLCNQMLAYAGKGKFVIGPVNLSQLVQDTTKLLRVSISKKATMSLGLTSDLPSVMADANQMRQVIMNLVMNASDAMGEESGSISVATTLVQADRDDLNSMMLGNELQPGPYVSLEVTDTGCGMDEATRGRIFEPFFTTKFTGRGLGLAAVLGIVRSHGGALRVESAPGEGTTFRILFPATTSSAEVHVVKSTVTLQGSGVILVADDEDSVRKLAVVFLQTLGFQTIEARDGQEAVEVANRQGQEIRAALIDLTMPRLDGRQAVAEIRRLVPTLPVIIMSGYTEAEIGGWFAGDGLVKFLQKPFTKGDLTERLAEVLALAGG